MGDSFPGPPGAHVKITSFGTVRPVYPTTFYEVEIYAPGDEVEPRPSSSQPDERAWLTERGGDVRALGGSGAAVALLTLLEPSLRPRRGTASPWAP